MNQLKRNEEYQKGSINFHGRLETPNPSRQIRGVYSQFTKLNMMSTPNPRQSSRNPFSQESEPGDQGMSRMRSRYNSTRETTNSRNQQRGTSSSYRDRKMSVDIDSKNNRYDKNGKNNKNGDQPDLLTILTEGINRRLNQNKSREQKRNVQRAVKKIKLMCTNTISIQHFYDDEEPIDFKGNLISKFNHLPILKMKSATRNQTILTTPKKPENTEISDISNNHKSQKDLLNTPTTSNKVHDDNRKDKNKTETAEYKRNKNLYTNLYNIIDTNENANSNKNNKHKNIIKENEDTNDFISLKEYKGNKNARSSSKLVDNDELQFVTPIITTPRSARITTIERKPRGKSAPHKTDTLVNNLFADDGLPISFFDFDFATSYVIENDEVIHEIPPRNNFPLIDILETKSESGKLSTLHELVQSTFGSTEENKSNISLTSLVQPHREEINFCQKTNKIDAISPTSFFDFRFGTETSDFSPDRLHIFTWHNLGIPASLIAKNLIIFISTAKEHLNLQVQIKAILQYLIIWIKYFPNDFDENSRCADIVFQLLKVMANKNKGITPGINIMRNIVEDLSEGVIKPEELKPLLHPLKFRTFAKSNRLIHLSIDPYVMANHLAFIDLNLIHQLQRNEFMHNNWRENPEASPNFHQLMSRFNDTVQFIITSILIETDKRRARNISYWVKMMYHARKEHNYHLLAIIDSALSSLPIMRLTSSWKMVNDNALLAFSRLHNFFKRTENQKEMFVDPTKSIPFIGIFLAQLYQIEDENSKTILKSGNSGYNLVLQRKTLSIIEQIFLPWGTGMNFELDNAILNECQKLNGKITTPNQMIEVSLKIEPMKNSEKTILGDFC
ncbi:hypothetical protein TRFO_17481 [Tritrichomonas foetus]|uniref:Ras-GEF domain-containing protein n=1 Tax=Tritrichomonas foetus TaxID=1144522 RepID=A0A1J4KT41_9EUKA|nr:hypothetical protein TRFO_17481 [Tritrichomonas foetus]|eukprot:OHT12653.1 hypothetical protein TRFO_17481 [Tritrichomonas foetus]